MMDVADLVRQLQRAADAHAVPPVTLAQWRDGFRASPDTFAGAVAAGTYAGQLAFAFAGGYQSALRQLLPTLAPDDFAALLLSEGKRQRPDELLTTLTPLGGDKFRLDGEKSWVAGGAAADSLLVVARQGVASDGRVRTAMVLLPAHAPGVEHDARTETGFLSALPHGRARFDGVTVSVQMILPGDGWMDYARPFRTIEDIHVSAAVAAHLAVNALRRRFPDALLASVLACLSRLADCMTRDVNDAANHVLLAAAERELQQAAAQVNDLISGQDDGFARDWRANYLLVALAAPARGKRLAKALATLAASQ